MFNFGTFKSLTSEDMAQDEAREEAAATTGSADGGNQEDQDDDEDYSNLESSNVFFCDTIVADGLPKGVGVPTEVCLRL